MKIFRYISIITLFIAVFFGFSAVVYAAIPTLSVNNTTSNAVQITVFGDPSSTINLYYRNGGSYFQSVGSIGSTNSNGYFTWVTGNNYPVSTLTPGSEVYVTVNGQNSATVIWPYNSNGYPNNQYPNNSYPYNGIVLNNANLSLNVGQSLTLTPNAYVTSLYISSNSNSYVARAYVTGNQITLTGNNPGTTNMYVCATNNNCATFTITVQQPTYNPYTPYTPYQSSCSYQTYPYFNYPCQQYQSPAYPSTPNLPPIIYYPTSSYPYNYNYGGYYY